MNRLFFAAAAAISALILMPQPAAAHEGHPHARISQVAASSGEVTYILSGEGLAAGQSIDPASVVTTLGGTTVPSTAVSTNGTAQQTVILAVDTSGSMLADDRIGTAKAAAKQFLAEVPAEVAVGMVSFADDARLVIAPTTDRAKVTAAIDGLTANGSTALNDAVALSTLTLGTEGSRNIVLLSDGKDEGSDATAKQARGMLADSGVVLDAVSIGDGTTELAAYAKAGNGTVVTATDKAALTSAFQQIARSVTTQLTVTATVPAGTPAGTVNLGVTAKAGETPITDTSAVTVQAAPAATGPVAAEPSSGFLSGSWVPWLVAGLVFAGLLVAAVIAVGAIDPEGRKSGRIARRLEGITPDEGVTPTAVSTTALGDSAALRSVVSFADRVAKTRDTTGLDRRLDVAAITLRPGEWVVIHAGVAVGVTAIVALFTGFAPLASLAALAVGVALPWLVLNFRGNKRRKEFYAALPDAMQMLSGSLSAGYSLPQAVDSVAREDKGVLGEELRRALLESRMGLPLEEALDQVAKRMDSEDFDWVVMAIAINRRVGGNLAEVLSQVGKTLRERERLRRQVKTLSAEGLLSAWVIGLLPVALLLFFMASRPGYLAPMTESAIGLLVLAVGALLYVTGIVWLFRTVKLEV